MPRTQKGFTLIELLIVVVIIGILAAIAIPKFADTKRKAYVTVMKLELKNMVPAAEAGYASNSTYAGAVLASVSPSGLSLNYVGTERGWLGFASHTGAPGAYCFIGAGSQAALLNLAEGQAGGVQCK
jgi:prepilin-type N-terminal cleavage/methylation domain-containing protein